MEVSFEQYKKYVAYRVVNRDSHPTMLRGALELCEEYLEFSLEPSVEELGDMYFWWAYFCYISQWELGDTMVKPEDQTPLMETIKNIAGIVKRYYRDKNVSKLKELRDQMPILGTNIAELRNALFPDLAFDELRAKNVEKLNARFGDCPDLDSL